ncbi:MAG: carbohydrate porin [Pseudomonadota bacterium]
MKHTTRSQLGLAIAAALFSSAAAADSNPIDFNGYIRGGVGSNSEKGQQTCFGLAGAGGKYRLGNECDFFTEFTFGYTLPKAADGATFKAVVMPGLQFNPYNGDPNPPPVTYLRQAYVEGSGIPELGGATIWAGRRFYKRNNYYPLDFYYWNDALTGAGIDNFPVWAGSKLSYAISRSNGVTGISDSATRHEFQWSDLPANAEGKINLGLTVVAADSDQPGTHGGTALSVQHAQGFSNGGKNKLTLQYGRGGAVDIGFVGNRGLTPHPASDSRSRLVDEVFFQMTPRLSGQADLIYQRDRFAAGAQTWTSYGTRLNYALTSHIKLVGDVGHDIVRPDGAPQRQLTKLTVAPAISLGNGYWDRPSIYFYYTYAKWNDAARAAAAATSALSASGPFGVANHGATVGVFLEAWW